MESSNVIQDAASLVNDVAFNPQQINEAYQYPSKYPGSEK